MLVKAVIFDLDGVIVSTDEYHYRAWKHIADDESIYFDREHNDRLRGVSRKESLDIILQNANRSYTLQEKEELLLRKNDLYRKYLEELSHKDILPYVVRTIKMLKEDGIKIAIGSSSKNAKFILSKLGLDDTFDAIIDGTMIKKSKPDPEVFLSASNLLQVNPNECVVVEDAIAGVESAQQAGMEVIGIGHAVIGTDITYKVENLRNIGEIIQEITEN